MPDQRQHHDPPLQEAGTSWEEHSFKEIVHPSVATVELEVLLQALKYTRGNKAKAARLCR